MPDPIIIPIDEVRPIITRTDSNDDVVLVRWHNRGDVRVQYTDEEEIARDAEIAYVVDPQREVERTDKEEVRLMNHVEVKGIDRAQFAALLDHENRLRALEVRPEITAQDLKDWVKARL